MKRKTIAISSLNISYLDNEKGGQVFVCLHGHYGSASMFAFLESHYEGRLVMMDQRGHGFSDHADSYTRQDYIGDLKGFIEALHIENPILLGHSLGGINVLQYAAKYHNAKKLIIEDIGTKVVVETNYFKDFPEKFDSIWDANMEFLKLGRPLSPFFMENLHYDGTKWKFRFNYAEIAESMSNLAGNYWAEWESIDCPILLLHGRKSWACKTENMEEMAERNRKATLKIYENASHAIHEDSREEFTADVIKFIRIEEK